MSVHKWLIRHCAEIARLAGIAACIQSSIAIANAQGTGHITEGSGRYTPDPHVLSDPTLEQPIYACAGSVRVDGVASSADEVRVFARTPLSQGGGFGPEQLIGVKKLRAFLLRRRIQRQCSWTTYQNSRRTRSCMRFRFEGESQAARPTPSPSATIKTITPADCRP